MINLTKDELEIAILIIGESIERDYPLEVQPAELRAAMLAGDRALPPADDILRRFPDHRERTQFFLVRAASILGKLTSEYLAK